MPISLSQISKGEMPLLSTFLYTSAMFSIYSCTLESSTSKLDQGIEQHKKTAAYIGRQSGQDYQDDFGSMNNFNAEEPLFNKVIVCQPGRVYQYPCILCVCHPSGYFHASDCIHVCHNVSTAVSYHTKCIPKTIFKVDRYLCYCPLEGVIDKQYCSQKSWALEPSTEITSKPIAKTFQEKKASFQFRHFHKFKFLPKMKCTASTFTEPLCQYCSCHPNGAINFNECIEVDCKIASQRKPMNCDSSAFTSICQQCLCTKNSTIIDEYCHYLCNNNSKAVILKKLVSKLNIEFFPPKKHLNDNNTCQPGSLYKSTNQYCFCPSTGVFNKDYCLVLNDQGKMDHLNVDSNKLIVLKQIESGDSCIPGQYFRSTHKQCYCPMNGEVDSEWCIDINTSEEEQDKTNLTCIPGQIVTVECNLCFCSVNGNIDHHKCTRNKCDSTINESLLDDTSCVTGTVYTTGCISCMCPSDHQININYCHKTKDCMMKYDDLATCNSRELYAQGCEICVCPLNGVKSDSVCYDGLCPSTHVVRRNTFTPVVCNVLEIKKNFNLCEMCLCGHCTILACQSIYSCQSGDLFHLGPRTCHCQPVDSWHARIECGNVRSSDSLIGRTSCYVNLIGEENCLWTEEEADEAMKLRDCTPGTMYYHGCQQCICALNHTLGNFCKNSTNYCERPYPGGTYHVSRAGINQEMVFLNVNEDPMKPCLEGLLYYVDQCSMCPCINGLLDTTECYSSTQCVTTSL